MKTNWSVERLKQEIKYQESVNRQLQRSVAQSRKDIIQLTKELWKASEEKVKSLVYTPKWILEHARPKTADKRFEALNKMLKQFKGVTVYRDRRADGRVSVKFWPGYREPKVLIYKAAKKLAEEVTHNVGSDEYGTHRVTRYVFKPTKFGRKK